MKFIAAVFLVLSACGPVSDDYEGDPQENAVNAFTSVYGAPSQKCEQRALDTEITYLSVPEVREACNDQHVVGCVQFFGDSAVNARAYVAEGQNPGVLAHETLHVLMICEGKWDDNQNHSGAVWHAAGIH